MTDEDIEDLAGSGGHLSKLASYLEQENSVLHSKLRQLEIKLEKAEKALAVEREKLAASGTGRKTDAEFLEALAKVEASWGIANGTKEDGKP